MKFINFLLSLIVTISLCILLNQNVGNIPPLGKFLNPFSGFWQNMMVDESKAPKISKIDGLESKVTVYYDEQLIPHIQAESNRDAYILQGYVEARHRLWQMDFQTRASAGRLSEVFGKRAIEYDRRIRRIGLPFGAENLLKNIKDDKLYDMVSAYAEGVNAWISSLSYKEYPVEFKLLNYKPEKWEVLNTALLLSYMSNILATSDYSIENTNFINKFGSEDFDYLFPDYEKEQDPIIPTGTIWNQEDGVTSGNFEMSDVKISEFLFERNDDILGSNNWAIAPQKSKSGKPILANDPHLRLSLPSIWFQTHLITPNSNVYGVSFPGTPTIIIGFNDDIAWGVTNAGRDVRDWYEVKFLENSKYEFSGKQYDLINKQEIIKIKGGSSFVDEIYFTHLGPVVYMNNNGSDKHLALKWTAHNPGKELTAFMLLNSGKNIDDYKEGLMQYNVPGQNFVFASKEGDIAIKQQGRFPYHHDERGKFIIKSEDNDGAWQFVPYDANPMVINPDRNYVSSANQHPTDSTYPFRYDGHFEQYRNRRINNILSGNSAVGVEDMMKLHVDNYNIQAEESLKTMLNHISGNEMNAAEKSAFEILDSWDFYNEAERIAPSYYQVWWDTFYNMTWDEMIDDEMLMRMPHKFRTVDLLVNDPEFSFFDIVGTDKNENAKEVLWLAFRKAVSSIEKWKKETGNPAEWWRIKATEIKHLTRQINAFSKLNVKIGGNKGIVNATSKNWGPSWRMIVHLDDPLEAYGIYPGGQSGSPGSPFYTNFIDMWARGEYYELNYDRNPKSFSDEIIYSFHVNP